MFPLLFLWSIVFFFFLLFFFGFSLFYIARIHMFDSFFLRVLLYLGCGLGTLVFLIILFDVVGFPLDYKIFFFVSILCPLHFLFFRLRREIFSRSSFVSLFTPYSFYYIVTLFATLVLFFTYLSGAFVYPYLEDDDPWGHAIAVKYIAEEKTYNQDYPERISHYLEPYPPSYDALLALLYQINGSIFLTLKIFNVLLIALGILFFFVFVLELFDIKIATVATLVLVALPSWMSHFIWSHTLALVLFFPTMTIAYRGFSDSRWMIPAIILIAAMMITHPFVSVLFGIFYLCFVAWNFYWSEKRLGWNPFTKSVVIGALGLLLSFFYWGQQLFRHGLEAVLYSHSGGFGGHTTFGAAATEADLYINPVYTLYDLLIAPIFTKIDQPTGFGVLAFVLAFCGIMLIVVNYRKYFAKEKMHSVVILWFIITFLGLLGGHLPFSILTHRFWAYVSISLAILVGIFVVWLLEKCWSLNKLVIFCFLTFFLFFGIFGVPFTTDLSFSVNPTYNTTTLLPDIREQPFLGTMTAINMLSSWQPKKIMETSQWPPGISWSSVQELEGYMWMHQNIVGKRVLSLCKEERFLIGFDMETHFPNKEIEEFRKNLATTSVDEIVSRVVGYEYVSLEYSCVKKGYLSEEELNALANQLSQYFPIIYFNDEIVVYKVSE